MKLNAVALESFNHPLLAQHNISVQIKRDDLLHPVVSGNKLYKLMFNLEQFQREHKKTLITFGGAYSNHLHATAFMGRQLGVQTVAIVRGEQLIPLNPTLKDCTDWGMILEPVCREQYRQKQRGGGIQSIIDRYPSPYVVPEGGANRLGVLGAAKMLDEVDQEKLDMVVVACGTGVTMAGLISACEPHVRVVGFPALKAEKWMADEVQGWLDIIACKQCNWALQHDYHFGGYAKTKPELLAFMDDMEANYNLLLDPIYTAKAFYGLLDMIARGEIARGSNLLFIHSGGLQGRRGLGGGDC
ncbi:MAG: pyridoxal-phosphate dependent enzyme [Bermanella sp.]